MAAWTLGRSQAGRFRTRKSQPTSPGYLSSQTHHPSTPLPANTTQMPNGKASQIKPQAQGSAALKTEARPSLFAWCSPLVHWQSFTVTRVGGKPQFLRQLRTQGPWVPEQFLSQISHTRLVFLNPDTQHVTHSGPSPNSPSSMRSKGSSPWLDSGLPVSRSH